MVVRLVAAPPGRNSATVPVTVTASPTATVGAVRVKTNRPSLVAGSASGVGSWNQKPLLADRGDHAGHLGDLDAGLRRACAAPWMSWMRRPGTPGSGGGAVLPVLRGFGAPAAKSAALLSVSGPSPRRAAVVLDRAGGGAVSKSLARAVADEVAHAGRGVAVGAAGQRGRAW